MRRAPISRRGLVVGAGVTVAAAALPIGVVTLAVEEPAAADPAVLPAMFDPRAFCNDLIDAGYRMTVVQPVWCGSDDGDDLGPYYFIRPAGERSGFGDSYSAVMAKWRGAMNTCPDDVEQVIAYALGQLEVTS